MPLLTKKTGIIAAIIAALFIIWSVFAYYQIGHRALLQTGQTTIKVPINSTVHDLAAALKKQKLIQHPHYFVLFAEFHGLAKGLRFGEYKITSGMSAYDLLKNVQKGRGLVKHRITFIEGWTFKQMMQRLNQDSDIRHKLQGKTDAEIMTALGHPGQHPEGRFFPNTYVFTWGNTDIDILQHAYNNMQRFLKKQWPQRASGLPYRNAYQALIVASLIEKETALQRERPMIAGVILRRLKKGIRLHIDPTILYGLGKPFSTPITRKDLKTDTPYNTYLRYGLPPTPIDMPSGASIKAALHPDHGEELYYVSRGDGSHQFSKTYKQHLLAVNKYQRGQWHIQLPLNKQSVPRYLRRAPLLNYASYIVCFMCL